jgi:citronellol/citronellal dehydrogenase
MSCSKLAARTVLITGASRGFGRAIAEKVAADGANVIVLAKTTTPHPLIEGTIYDTEKAVLAAGGKCLAIGLDVRHEDAVRDAIEKTVATFGGIDVVINNASAMHPYRLQDLDVKKFNLMNDVIMKGTFYVTKYSLPHLKNSPNPHILNICPPIHIVDSWFKYLGHLAVMKYAVSLSTLSLSQELAQDGIAVNALWPKTAFWSAFMSRAGGYTESLRQYSRKPDIMSDAAYCMITKDSRAYTGNFMYDDDVLLSEGVTDFEAYAEVPGNPLMVDIFVKDEDCRTFTPLSTTDEALKNVQRMLKTKL